LEKELGVGRKGPGEDEGGQGYRTLLTDKGHFLTVALVFFHARKMGEI